MKNLKIYIAVLVAGASVLLTSCGGRSIGRLEAERDSLMVVVGAKDSLLNTIFADINAITGNLAQIKERENMITVVTAEGEVRPAEQIAEDIAAIDRLLKENRDKIASLQSKSRQLRKANLRIDELDKTITQLNARLDEQSGEIVALRGELEKKGIEVAELTEAIAARNAVVEQRDAEVRSLSGEKRELENQMNTVYYIVGADRELRDAQIIDRQGRVTTAEIGLDSFVRTDARMLREIAVGKKRVSILTPHAEGSYRMVVAEDKTVEKIEILDTESFWEASKILIVSFK